MKKSLKAVKELAGNGHLIFIGGRICGKTAYKENLSIIEKELKTTDQLKVELLFIFQELRYINGGEDCFVEKYLNQIPEIKEWLESED